MNVAIIEINDSGLYCGNDRGELIVSPGYALLTKQGITTGKAAFEHAYLEPQQSFNQYWRQLNLSPLPAPNNHARHHADLAYAQLLELHRESGSPQQIIFATPGSFDRDQLSILLGLAKASPFEAVGIVDSAVAAASQSGLSGQLLHLDIQLHQCVLTRLNADNPLECSDTERSHIERTNTEVIADIGLKTFYDIWAQHIANMFIRQYRYDPLHTAAGEQQLYDLLPNWLDQITETSELAIALDSPQGSYRLNLNRSDLLASSRTRLDQLQKKVRNIWREGETVIASHRTLLLQGFSEQLGHINTLPNDAVIQGCLKNLDAIVGNGETIHFVTRLPSNSVQSQMSESTSAPKPTPAPVSTPTITATPTHALYQHKAHDIGGGLYLRIDNDQLIFSHQHTGDISLTKENGKIQLRSDRPDLSTSNNRDDLPLGATIHIGVHQLQLIEVT
ncbi:MAG: hypothetical protein V7725_01495 [Porticoccus sp.]